MKEPETPKKGQVPKQNTAARKTPARTAGSDKTGSRGSTMKRQTASTGRGTSQKKPTPKRTAPQNTPPQKSGLSFMTVLLILVSIAVAAFLIWFCIDKLMPKQTDVTQSLPPVTDVSPNTPAGSTTALTPLTPPALTVTPSVTPTVSPTPSPDPTPTTTPDPTPSKQSPEPPDDTPDTSRVFLKADTNEETVSIRVEDGIAHICYTTPYLTIPYDTAVEATVNNAVDGMMLTVRNKLEKNIKDNFDPMMYGEYTVNVETSLFRSEHSFSIVLRYQTIAGKGESIDEVTTATFDAASGKKLTLEDVLTDRDAMIRHLQLLLPAEEDRDIGFLKGHVCSGFYFDREDMVMLYSGRKLYTTSPLIKEQRVTDQKLFTGN